MELIFSGHNNKRFSETALKYGYKYGSQLPSYNYFPVYFADQDWKNPNRNAYMKALKQERPEYATVLDLEHEDQLEEVLSWANEASQYVKNGVIIVPKYNGAVDKLPRTIQNKQVILGYSVPTRYDKTNVPVEEFANFPVHLLGGSPHEQLKLRNKPNIISADENYTMKMANMFNAFWVGGTAYSTHNRYFPQLRDVGLQSYTQSNYKAFELSIINVRNAWNDRYWPIRYASLEDEEVIVKIHRENYKVLGAMNRVSLREQINKMHVYVCFFAKEVIGYVEFNLPKQGKTKDLTVIYEIAVRKAYHGLGIGSSLLNSFYKPLFLKVTKDNLSAIAFYESNNLKILGYEKGRKRELIQVGQIDPLQHSHNPIYLSHQMDKEAA